jgi:hypothetical protein
MNVLKNWSGSGRAQRAAGSALNANVMAAADRSWFDRVTERMVSASRVKVPDGDRIAVEMAVMASSP